MVSLIVKPKEFHLVLQPFTRWRKEGYEKSIVGTPCGILTNVTVNASKFYLILDVIFKLDVFFCSVVLWQETVCL